MQSDVHRDFRSCSTSLSQRYKHRVIVPLHMHRSHHNTKFVDQIEMNPVHA